MSDTNDSTCEYCHRKLSRADSLSRHLKTCRSKARFQDYENQIRILKSEKEGYERELKRLSEGYERELKRLSEDYERNLTRLSGDLQLQRELTQSYHDEIVKIAMQPTTTTTTVMTSNNQRTVNILNQLGAYEFNPETIARILEERFTKEVFQGGPDKIAELTAEVLLHDAEQKPKVVCTDLSRKTFRFIDPITQKLETDPGFLKTHSLLKRPLFEANLNVFSRDFMRIDDDDDTYRNQWKLNDDFISNPHRFPEKLFPFLSRRI